MDDEGRIWVKRAVPADTPPFFDLFADEGDYLGSIRLTFTPAPYRPLWVPARQHLRGDRGRVGCAIRGEGVVGR